MKLLLDTHVFLWWMLDDPRLSRIVIDAIANPSNEVFLSSVTGIELATKVAGGKLKVPTTIDALVSHGMAQSALRELPLTLAHTYELAKLPLLHRDPFDRLIIAQAKSEGMTLVSFDSAIAAYNVPLLR